MWGSTGGGGGAIPPRATAPRPSISGTLPRDTSAVLVGLDEGVGGELALEWAVREAATIGAPVLALTAWSWEARMLPAVGLGPRRLSERIRDRQEEQISRVLRRVGRVSCRIDTELAEADPASTLLDHSAAARLLVVGSRTDPARSAVGSVARTCLSSAACPVVVVPVRAAG